MPPSLAVPLPGQADASPWLRRLDVIARVAVLVMLPGMLHAFVLAEIAIAVTGAAFLARSALLRDWSWLSSGWFPLGLAWWGWLIFCSLPGIGYGGLPSLTQAIVAGRYLLLVAALEHWVLRDAATRRWLWWIIAVSAAYIAAQTALQWATGYNLWGEPRWMAGQITGPFFKPRAGAPMSRLLFPALLPVVALLLRRRNWGARIGAWALIFAGVATAVLIGQRMPLVMTLFGLVVAALLLRELRRPVLLALLAGALLLAALPVLSPPTFYRDVTKFAGQLEDFPRSDYGMILNRAVVMAEQHPWLGRGFNGFRTGCADPRYFHGWNWPADPTDDGGGLAGCNIHPHNHYLEVLTDAGVPGLVLFSALVVAWLVPMGHAVWRRPEPLLVGLFVAALIHQWPISSNSSAFAIEIGGIFFLLLGYGLAEAREEQAPALNR